MNSTGLARQLENQQYDLKAFKKADRLERIFVYLTTGGETSRYQLSNTEKEYLGLMERAYALLFEHRSKKEAIKILQAYLPSKKNDWTGPKIMHNAQLIFGHFEKVNRTVQRGIVREAILARIKYVEEKLKPIENGYGETVESGIEPRDYAAIEKVLQGYWKELRELDQLHAQEDGPKRDTTIPEIVFTDNPEVLQEAEQEIDAEIIE
ncbi:MAG: hypothetical protein AAFU03_04295 [Bacteroidota bacterium]